MMDLEDNSVIPMSLERTSTSSSSPLNAPRKVVGKGGSNDSGLRDLIKKQKANGSFDLACLMSTIPSSSLDNVKRILIDLKIQTSDQIELLMITAIVCAYFETRYKDYQTSWALVVKKSKAWVKKEAEKANITADLDAAALNFLKSFKII